MEKFIKLFIRIFFIALAIYLIFWHPLFVLLTIIIIGIIGYFLFKNLEEISDSIKEFFNR